MSDLETRLTQALRSGSESAPDALGLADSARGRARTRRHARAAGMVAGVAAVLLPVAVVAFGGDDGAGEVPAADASPTGGPTGYGPGRWETWHGVTLQVPDDWQYGDVGSWCAGGGSASSFRVTRPGGVLPMVQCTPASSYGVTFQDIEMAPGDEPFDWPVVAQAGDTWPDGTFVGAHGEAGVLVTVAGPVRDDVAAVLDTVRRVESGVDAYGCSVEDDGGPGMAAAATVPVCRYDEQGRLVQSELLRDDDAAAAVAAVRAAQPATSGRTCRNGPTEYVVLGVEGDRVEVQFAGNGACVDRGVVVEGVRHQLTADVLFWALSPGWSGSVDASVPLPDELRTYTPPEQ